MICRILIHVCTLEFHFTVEEAEGHVPSGSPTCLANCSLNNLVKNQDPQGSESFKCFVIYFNLFFDRAEKLQLLNHRPMTAVEIQLVSEGGWSVCREWGGWVDLWV